MKTKDEVINELTSKRRQIVTLKENGHGDKIYALVREVEQLGKELMALI